MKKLCLFVGWVSVFMGCAVLQAQDINLVPNPGFEEVTGNGPCYFVTIQNQFDQHVEDWFLPTYGTSDIYSTSLPTNCALNVSGGGANKIGVTSPHEGNRFAGLATIDAYISHYREYLSVKLKEPLVVGTRYHAEMYVTRADLSLMATNGLGFLFTTSRQDYMNTAPIKKDPQVYEADIFHYSNGWIKIEGEFVADSAYEYITIGNFFDDIMVKDSIMNTSTSPYYPDHGYYFIDDVSVFRACSELIDLPDTLSLCVNETVELRPAIKVVGFYSYLWNTGATTQSIEISDTGHYSLDIDIKDLCTVHKEINVITGGCFYKEFPNIITPNNDGVNDRFKDRLFDLEEWDLYVYNRYGIRVYFSSPYKNDWDPELADGMYFYEIRSTRFLLDSHKGWFRISN